MKRRAFIAGLGSAAACPLTAHAQQVGEMRRVGVLMGFAESDVEANSFLSAFMQRFAELGWIEGRNLKIELRWAAGTADRARMFARELVSLQPDVILASTTPVTAALRRETHTIPIVFAFAGGDGIVSGLPPPGENITGFMGPQPSMAVNWLELLTKIAPSVGRVAALVNPETTFNGGADYLTAFEAAVRSVKVDAITGPVRSDSEIEKLMTSLGREPGAGLVVIPSSFMVVHRATIISLAARNNLPAVYYLAAFAKDGGLLSYWVDTKDVYRRAAPYVDTILRGVRPSDLPIQLPIKFELFVNAKTAKALGLTIPETLLATADEVIQ
jgi:putative tryptophan/tyrosine transport system substrate-binding protein